MSRIPFSLLLSMSLYSHGKAAALKLCKRFCFNFNLSQSVDKIFEKDLCGGLSSSKVSDLRKFYFHRVLKTLIDIIVPFRLLLIYLNNPLKRKRLTSHVRKETKLTKSNYFV